MMDHPTFCRIEYWNHLTADWQVGHSGINLMNPARYVQELTKRDIIARAVNKETGEVVYSEGGDLL